MTVRAHVTRFYSLILLSDPEKDATMSGLDLAQALQKTEMSGNVLPIQNCIHSKGTSYMLENPGHQEQWHGTCSHSMFLEPESW